MSHLGILFSIFFAVSYHSFKSPEEILPYRPVENYPNDQLLEKITEKRAMVINAHDDDMCGIVGTLSQLKAKGWKIVVLTIPQSDERNTAHRKACKKLSDSVAFFSVNYPEFRTDWGTNKTPYSAIPVAEFGNIFHSEKLEQEIIQRVNSFQPSVIFTLDHEIGGYGHPEHVLVCSTVLKLAQTKKINLPYLYQSVYAPSMMEKIMERHSKRMISWGFPGDGWEKAKQIYQLKTLPQPTVQINIQSEAQVKMNWLFSYNERERKTMDFYVPAFGQYSAEKYFEVFDREFFRVFNF
jgi:LmbE family N-acetylglucosaminyl deacetylase